MQEILNQYEPITLEDMKEIRLMNRIDTKFVTTVPVLRQLLDIASPYYTLYFDTDDCKMYQVHEAGHLVRQKLRIRSYVDAGLNFLEVKTKNNHGRTKKKRMAMEGFDALNPDHAIRFERQNDQFMAYDDFLQSYLRYDPQSLTEQLENRFDRITLVNKGKTERLTIDSNLRFHNISTDQSRHMGDIVIIELKRDGLKPSPILPKLLELRIHPHGFSKYCMLSEEINIKMIR